MSVSNGGATGIGLTGLDANGTTIMEGPLDEKAKLVSRERRVSTQTAARLRIAVLTVSWISVVGLGILGIATLAISIIGNSSASFAFALDAWLDCLSSAVVLWRYFSPAKIYSAKREKAACIALGVLFIISAIVIITKSALSITEDSVPKKSNIIWYLSIVNAIACLLLMTAKAYLARKLESIAVATDAVNSCIGAILALSTLISDIVYQHDRSVWYLDATVGIVCSFFLLAYGVWVIVFELCFAKSHEVAE